MNSFLLQMNKMPKILITVCMLMIVSIALNVYLYQNSEKEKKNLENTKIVDNTSQAKTDTENSQRCFFKALTEEELVQIVKSADELKEKSVEWKNIG